MKKSMVIIGVVLGLLLLVYFMLPQYARVALIYQKVGIDDYPIFHNREVTSEQHQKWKNATNINKYQLPDSILKSFADYQTIAFLVIKDTQVIYESYWDGYSDSSLTNSFSMAKSIVGFAIGAAIDDGFIESINQPVSDFIPEFDKELFKRLCIKDVLTMSSGLNWDESYGSLFSTTTEAYYGNDINKLIFGLEIIEQPGARFKYLSGNTQILAMIVEHATGKHLADYVAEKFWKPMGARQSALWCLDNKDGMEKAYCCFNSNARDFARWGQLALNRGIWNNDTLLSPDYVLASLSPASYLADDAGNDLDFYGYHWWIHHFNNRTIPYMRGILGQYVFVIPDENAVVVRLGHRRDDNKLNHHPLDTYLYLEAARQILSSTEQIVAP